MTQEQLERELKEISDIDLAEKVSKLISKLCETGGQSFRMTVPVQSDDSDMLLCELVKRFKKYSIKDSGL